jgi:methionine aminotransferase
VHVPLDVPSFGVDWERVRAAMSERTRLIVLNFPHNPSGAVLAPADLDELARIVRSSRTLILSDEVYEHIVFEKKPHQSVLRHPELSRRSYCVSSFGKSFHATGWKVGWVAAPPELTNELRKVHQFVTFATSTPAQHAFADVLEAHPEHLASLSPFYEKKRDYFRALLANVPLTLLPVAGSYFQLVDYSRVSTEDDLAFSRRLTTELGVAAIPLSPFYAAPPGHRIVRFCFAKREPTLEAAAERQSRHRAA